MKQGSQSIILAFNLKALRLSAYLLLWLAAVWLALSSAHAMDDKQAELKTLYNALLSDPTDLDATLNYATLAVEIGDYESAIPPLERLLLTYPNSAKLKLELGALYHKLGAAEVARGYFSDVIADEAASNDHRSQADSMLKAL